MESGPSRNIRFTAWKRWYIASGEKKKSGFRANEVTLSYNNGVTVYAVLCCFRAAATRDLFRAVRS